MKKTVQFILIAFCFSALSSRIAQSQSACNGTIFGIPVCTGFCLDKKQEDPKRKERIKELRHKADSLNKEAKILSDSLKGDLETDHRFFLNSDSLNFDGPFHIYGKRGPSNEFLVNPFAKNIVICRACTISLLRVLCNNFS